MKNFWNYLYYKYYYWQIKLGNKDVAAIMAILFIAFITLLFVISITSLIAIIMYHIKHIQISIFSKTSALITWGSILIFYSFYFFHKKRYKTIIKKETLKAKSNFWAIILPIIAVILPSLIFIILMLQNQGKL